MATPKKKAEPAPSNVPVFGKVKNRLGVIGDEFVVANIVNHILNKHMNTEAKEALEMYADPEDVSRIMDEMGLPLKSAPVSTHTSKPEQAEDWTHEGLVKVLLVRVKRFVQ